LTIAKTTGLDICGITGTIFVFVVAVDAFGVAIQGSGTIASIGVAVMAAATIGVAISTPGLLHHLAAALSGNRSISAEHGHTILRLAGAGHIGEISGGTAGGIRATLAAQGQLLAPQSRLTILHPLQVCTITIGSRAQLTLPGTAGVALQRGTASTLGIPREIYGCYTLLIGGVQQAEGGGGGRGLAGGIFTGIADLTAQTLTGLQLEY